MEGPPVLRKTFIRYAVAPGATLADLIADEAALSEFVRDGATPTWHACSTCRIGSKEDCNAVTDSEGSVYGVEGLSVGDASLMPDITRGNTGLPTIMIGEKVADAWRRRH
jgi:5-(hydroxymethyl)furfural/furfural oxidase